MEQDPLKAAWQGYGSAAKSNVELQQMLHEGRHPLLKHIRRQMVLEALAFTAFLCVYYNALDGDRKPLAVNMLLVAAMLLAIIHNSIVYWLTKHYDQANNLQQSLHAQLSRLKLHAALSVGSRALIAVCLLLFLTSVITFTAAKYWLLAVVIAIYLVQMVLLSRIWAGRVRQLQNTINSLFS